MVRVTAVVFALFSVKLLFAEEAHIVKNVDARHVKYEDVIGGAIASSQRGIVVVSFADDATSEIYLARMQDLVDNPTKWLSNWEQDEPPGITGLIRASPDERVEQSLNGEAWIFVSGRPYDRTNELTRFTTSLQDSVGMLYAQSTDKKAHTVKYLDGRHMNYESVAASAVAASQRAIVVVSFADDAKSEIFLARMQDFVDNPAKWLTDWERDEAPAIGALIHATPDERVEQSLNGEAWIFVGGRPYDRTNELARFTTSLQDSVGILNDEED